MESQQQAPEGSLEQLLERSVLSEDGEYVYYVFTREERSRLLLELGRLRRENAQLQEQNAALREGQALGPIIGAQTILEQAQELRRLRLKQQVTVALAASLTERVKRLVDLCSES